MNAPATFKDLCIDAVDAATLGEFWAGALHLKLNLQQHGDAFLTGPSEAHTIWINAVPEAKSVKHRVHLDVHGATLAELEDLGATMVDSESSRWLRMTDPEGGEFCLFVRETPQRHRLFEIVIDCIDHQAQSVWWAGIIGGEQMGDPDGTSCIQRIPMTPFDKLTFVSTLESKSTKNRVHMDLFAEDITALIDKGARLLRHRDAEIGWDVLADPEGNEFCVFPPRPRPGGG